MSIDWLFDLLAKIEFEPLNWWELFLIISCLLVAFVPYFRSKLTAVISGIAQARHSPNTNERMKIQTLQTGLRHILHVVEWDYLDRGQKLGEIAKICLVYIDTDREGEPQKAFIARNPQFAGNQTARDIDLEKVRILLVKSYEMVQALKLVRRLSQNVENYDNQKRDDFNELEQIIEGTLVLPAEEAK